MKRIRRPKNLAVLSVIVSAIFTLLASTTPVQAADNIGNHGNSLAQAVSDIGSSEEILQIPNLITKYPNVYIRGDVLNGYILGRKNSMASPLNTDGSMNGKALTMNNVDIPAQ